MTARATKTPMPDETILEIARAIARRLAREDYARMRQQESAPLAALSATQPNLGR